MSHLGHRSSMFNLIKASHFATNFIFIVVKLEGLFWPWLNTMKHVLVFTTRLIWNASVLLYKHYHE